MNLIETCKNRCFQNPRRVVFPDAKDGRVLNAAKILIDEKIAEPILIGGPFELREEADKHKISTRGMSLLAPLQCKDLKQYARQLFEARKHKGLTLEKAEEQLLNPLYFGASLVKNNAADMCIAGNLSTTADVLRAAIQVIGLQEGIETVSSFFLMLSSDGEKVFAFADCAVVPEPTAEQLSDIAYTTASNYNNILSAVPKVTMLSFSTKGSADHPAVEKIRGAVSISNQKYPELILDGEFQFDAAFVPAIGKQKAPGSRIQGDANVFIFPSLEAGNIGYKIAQRLGGYMALGPFIQGLKNPMHDLSRGCSVEDIVNSAIISSCMIN